MRREIDGRYEAPELCVEEMVVELGFSASTEDWGEEDDQITWE